MNPRLAILVLPILGVLTTAPVTCVPSSVLIQELVVVPGYVEPHTPGSGDALEMATQTAVSDLLGSSVDLNKVNYVRSYISNPSGGDPPRAIVILIPGFLGGAPTLDPIARDVVTKFNGTVEVWAVDRRPNQLEDRLGGLHASDGAAAATNDAERFTAVTEGVQFYFADTDNDPTGNFPGPEDLDINLDGVLDGQLLLPDPLNLPATRGPLIMTQDDARYMAHWGLDTYVRDWKILVDAARAIVGNSGLVLLGGHSQGTAWSALFAAYDFDPDPAVTLAGYTLIDGLILFDGPGPSTGSGGVSRTTYEATIADLATPVTGADVFLTSFSGLVMTDLGTSGEAAAVAAYHLPSAPSILQRTPVFGAGLAAILLSAPATNRALVGMFVDDDFAPVSIFAASFGFTDNGPNVDLGGFYRADPPTGGGLRTWKNFDDPTLPSIFGVPPCDPTGATAGDPEGVGCAIVDNGPPTGVELEVSDIDDFVKAQFGKANSFEWYFAAGRPNLDFTFGRDSSALVAEYLTIDATNEGPLVVTQNANVDVPVIALGGSNGLVQQASQMNSYLTSIASTDTEVHIAGGYAHLDVVSAKDNVLVPPLVDWINRKLQDKLLSTF